MNGSKKARNAQSIANRPTAGGPKKMGNPSRIGLPSNVFFIYRQKIGCPSTCPFPIYRGITTKGIIGNFPGRGL